MAVVAILRGQPLVVLLRVGGALFNLGLTSTHGAGETGTHQGFPQADRAVLLRRGAPAARAELGTPQRSGPLRPVRQPGKFIDIRRRRRSDDILSPVVRERRTCASSTTRKRRRRKPMASKFHSQALGRRPQPRAATPDLLAAERGSAKDGCRSGLLAMARRERRNRGERSRANVLYSVARLPCARFEDAVVGVERRLPPLSWCPARSPRTRPHLAIRTDFSRRDNPHQTNRFKRAGDCFGSCCGIPGRNEEWTAASILAKVERRKRGQRPAGPSRPNGIQLGFFSLAKLLMARIWNPTPGPNGSILDPPPHRRAPGGGFREQTRPTFPRTRLDEALAPSRSDSTNVDAEQLRRHEVIEACVHGRNLVVQRATR